MITSPQFQKTQELKKQGFLFERYSEALGIIFLIKKGKSGGWHTREVDEKGEVSPNIP